MRSARPPGIANLTSGGPGLRSVGGLRLASPALSFAKLRSDKSQAKLRRQQIPCRLIAVVMPTLCLLHVR
jgi:hypothetical protein